jgi:hypothetical protein
MANRTAKCAFAIFASVFASTPVTIVASSSARAADDCLTEPQGQAPQGQHWFYRTEHGTKQRCWYLRDQSDKSAQTDASADAAAPSQGNEPASSLSTTDSYAELPSQHPRAEQNGGASAARRASANASTAANVRDNATPTANAPIDSVFGPPPVVSGSPETSGVNSSANPPPETSAAEDASTTSEPGAAPVPAPLAAAPAQKEVGSLQMLLLVIFGALTLAGLSGSLVYRLGRARQTARAAQRRRDIWRSADAERRKARKDRQSRNLAAARADFGHRPGSSSRPDSRAGGVDERWAAGMDAGGMDAGGLDDKVERVEAFLSQLSKLAQSDAQSRPSRRSRA